MRNLRGFRHRKAQVACCGAICKGEPVGGDFQIAIFKCDIVPVNLFFAGHTDFQAEVFRPSTALAL